ncbi:hypothetical protein [Streptomyces geranii]|uniref:hypothetical protein n=1 Tax=Streptomyces geranii TaxID=2058923 RepID=UPI000D03F661|nr:hypothetical protein [Streptomyces geranii]
MNDVRPAKSGKPGRPEIGTYVMDTRAGKVGLVMGHEGPYVQLRSYGGGREWDAPPNTLRPATPAERLSAATAYANARSRGEVP